MLGQTIGRYVIVAPLGEGGMASVWKARDPLLERDVAVKLLSPALTESPEARRRFRREAELAQLLDHPAITPILGYGESGGRAWIAMALVTGETLADRMLRGLMPVEEACEVAAVVASALGYAHARGILHRDVTPRNIMLAADGRVFLLDFGLALVDGASRVTRSGAAPGTVAYMAPESLVGDKVDPRADLYSLGVVLFEMVTGAPPHVGESPQAILYTKLNLVARHASELRPGIPAALDALISRTLRSDANERPADADEFLMSIRDSTGHSSPPPTPNARSAGALLASGAGIAYLGVPAFEQPSVDDAPLEDLAISLALALRRRLGNVRRVHVVQGADPLGPEGDTGLWAQRHGANLVLLGRAVRRGARVRVECTLLDPVGGVSLAGDVVEGSLFDAFDLEDRVVAAVRQLFPTLGTQWAEEHGARGAAPDDADRFAQALRHLQRHDHEPSVEAAMGLLERLVEVHPQMAEYHSALARAYLAKYELTHQHAWESRAATILERAVQLAPALPAVRLALADLKSVAGHGQEAADLYRLALEEAPEHFDGWLGLARLHAKRDQFELAEAACRRAIALRPRDWRGYSTLGTVYFRQGRYGHAVAPWRRVLRLSPDHARAASNLAAALYHLDRFDESERAFRQSLDIEPTAASYANLGTVLYTQHRFVDALDAFQHACDLRPADARFWGYLGSTARWVPEAAERSRRAYERAVGLMREWLERNPEDAESWAIFSGWLAATGAAGKARAAIERALALAPRDMRCVIEAAHTYTVLGETDRALDHLVHAVRAGYGIGELERSIELEPLRMHARYQEAIADARRRRAEGRGTRARSHRIGRPGPRSE